MNPSHLPKLVLVLTAVWLLFATSHAFGGRTVHTLLAGGLGLLGPVLARWLHTTRAWWKGYAVLAWVTAGMAGTSLVSGQAASGDLWWLTILPVMAGLVVGARAAWIWGLVVVALITAVHASGLVWTIPAEFTMNAAEIWVRQLATAVISGAMAWFAMSALERESAALEAAVQAEREARMRQERFAAETVHELRTPLGGILGMAELLQRQDLSPEAHRRAEEIERQGAYLARLVDQVLDYSRVRARGVEFTPVEASVRDVVEDAIIALAPSSHQLGLGLWHAIAAEAEGTARFDPGRVRQVLVNLIGNAVKYTETGHVLVDVDRSGEDLFLRVRDTGPGLTPDQVLAAMEPYGRVGDGRILGTGLGLPLAKSYVEAMGGSLDVESTPGTGSTFTVRLPAEKVAPAHIAEPDASLDLSSPELTRSVRSALASLAPDVPIFVREGEGLGMLEVREEGGAWRELRWPARASSLRVEETAPGVRLARASGACPSVLVVDDSDVTREVLSMFVKAAGGKALVVATADAALEALQQERPSLVLVDQNLAGSSGIELAGEIGRRWPTLRIVGMSANTRSEDAGAWQPVASGFLPKPIALADVSKLLGVRT